MAGLLDSLSIATSALTAYRAGLDTVGQNIANVNTPGYARRTIVLAERPPSDPLSAGRGVDVVKVQAQRDAAIEVRIGHEQAGLANDSALLDGLSEVEAAIGAPGASIDGNLSAFFDAFSQLASDVTSPSNRDAVVKQGQILSSSFASLSGRLSQLRQTTDATVRDSVTQLNDLAAKVAQLNGQIMGQGADLEALVDERSATLSQIAELADVSVLPRNDGAVDLMLAQGQALVVGDKSYAVTTTPAPPNGLSTLSLGGFDITSSVTNGRLGGLLALRDSALPSYQTGLDQLAYDVATQVNAIHASGYDATGAAAGNFFAAPASVAGAAAALAVDPAVLADSQLVAGSSTGAVGDNQTAQALANLRNVRAMSGGTATPSEAWSNLVYRVGADVSAAQSASGTRDAIVRQLQQLRDQVSGVSLDEEAANLMKFQRSYEASARFFTTITDTLDTLMQMVA
jgi:flagellar hook-associated protein 1 FlgK